MSPISSTSHFPEWPYKGGCKICDACKVQHTPHRKAKHGPPDPDTEPPNLFGDQATMDHIIYGEGDQSQRKCKAALVCYERATHWLDSFPAVTNDTMCTKQALIEFYGGTLKPKKMYSDNAPELLKACSELEYPHDTSTPHRPQSNGVSERSARKVRRDKMCIATVWFAPFMVVLGNELLLLSV